MSKKILILAANPKDTSRLRLDHEVREIDSGLRRKGNNDFFLKQQWAVRQSDIRRAMLDFKPNIVHFCGHGSEEEGIAFEDDMGQMTFVGAEVLGEFFNLFSDEVECVLLNACYSEAQAEEISKYIKYVIGIKQRIEDTTAITFSIAFYDALVAGKTIELAYKFAMNAVQWNDIPKSLTPVLKYRTPVFVDQEKKLSSKIASILAATGGGSIGGIAGGLLFGGPLSILVGAAIGGIIGAAVTEQDDKISKKNDSITNQILTEHRLDDDKIDE